MPTPLILNTLSEAGTDTGKDVFLKLFLFFTVAVIFFVLGFLSQQRKAGRGKWLKYVFGWIPVIVGIVMMWGYNRYANDGFNTEATGMNAGQIGIYKAAPFVALGFGIILTAIGLFLDRRPRSRVEDLL